MSFLLNVFVIQVFLIRGISPILAKVIKTIDRKKMILGLTSMKIEKMANKTLEASSVPADTVIARAASALVYPFSVIMIGKNVPKVKSLVNTKLIPRHMLRNARFFIRDISTRSSMIRLFLKYLFRKNVEYF